MKILELKGAKVLTKSNQKEIKGGMAYFPGIGSCYINRACFDRCKRENWGGHCGEACCF